MAAPAVGIAERILAGCASAVHRLAMLSECGRRGRVRVWFSGFSFEGSGFRMGSTGVPPVIHRSEK